MLVLFGIRDERSLTTVTCALLKFHCKISCHMRSQIVSVLWDFQPSDVLLEARKVLHLTKSLDKKIFKCLRAESTCFPKCSTVASLVFVTCSK